MTVLRNYLKGLCVLLCNITKVLQATFKTAVFIYSVTEVAWVTFLWGTCEKENSCLAWWGRRSFERNILCTFLELLQPVQFKTWEWLKGLKNPPTLLNQWDLSLGGSSSLWQDCLGTVCTHTLFKTVRWFLKGATLPMSRTTRNNVMKLIWHEDPVYCQLLFSINREILSVPGGKGHHWSLCESRPLWGKAGIICKSLKCSNPALNRCWKWQQKCLLELNQTLLYDIFTFYPHSLNLASHILLYGPIVLVQHAEISMFRVIFIYN